MADYNDVCREVGKDWNKCPDLEPTPKAEEWLRDWGTPSDWNPIGRWDDVSAAPRREEPWERFRVMCHERFGKSPEEIDECLKGS